MPSNSRPASAREGVWLCSIFESVRGASNRNIFKQKLARRIGNRVTFGDVGEAILGSDRYRLCSIHSQDVRQVRDQLNVIETGDVCAVVHCTSRKELRRFSPESYFDLDMEWKISDGCVSLTGGRQNHLDLMGKKVCGSCLYAVTRGKQGNGTASVHEISPYPLYQATVRLITLLRTDDCPSAVSLSTLIKWDSSFRNPFQGRGGDSRGENMVGAVTAVQRICPALAAIEICLHTCVVGGKKQRFFVDSKASVQKSAAAAAEKIAQKIPTLLKAEHLSFDESSTMLDTRGKIYADMNLSTPSSYKMADFSLLEEIRAVPHPLWTRTALECASNDQRANWRSLLRRYRPQSAERVEDLFPLFNRLVPERSEFISKYERKFVSSVLFNIEMRVYARHRGAPGPFVSSIGTAGLLGMKRGMHILSIVGVSFSYTSASRFRDKIASLSEKNGRYPVSYPHSSIVISADNYDEAHLHQLHHAIGASHMFNGISVQLTTSEAMPSASCLTEGHNESVTCASQSTLLSGGMITKANDFVEKVVTKHDDPLILRYIWAFIGLCHRYQEKLTSTHPKKQMSVTNLLYSALQGFVDDTAKIVYVDLDRRQCDQSTLTEKLQQICCEYKPGKDGRCDFVAIAGGQPVFKMLFEMWHASLRNGYGLCEWLIPLPGGFHVEKQAILPLIKFCMQGAGLEALVSVCGLSEYYPV